MIQKNKFLVTIFLVALIKALLLCWAITAAGIGLAPDEAQYWNWSRQLDWGYYSKPPAIAWTIALGTSLFGNSEFGVRFFAMVLGFLMPFALYALAISCKLKKETAFWAAIVMALSPLGILSSFLATTDGGFVFFWTLALILLTNGISEEKNPNFLAIGFMILLGALFKWPIFIFWIVVVFSLLTIREKINFKRLFAGVLISLLGLLPSIVWNSSHDWATFKHVSATMAGGNKTGVVSHYKGNFFDFIGAQAGLISPVFFILFLCAAVYMFRKRDKVPISVFFCGIISLAILGVYAFLSLFQKMQGNWAIYAYPSAIILLSWYAVERLKNGKVWLYMGAALSVVLTALTLITPYLESHSIVKPFKIPYKLNLFHHQVGWNNMAEALLKAGYNPQNNFLFGDKYQMTSILGFYSPEQKRAYFFNLHKIRKNQFSYWPGMAEEQKGKTGFFVWVENSPKWERDYSSQIEHYQAILEPYFSNVNFAGKEILFTSYGQPAKGMLIFRCEGYNGKLPPETSLY